MPGQQNQLIHSLSYWATQTPDITGLLLIREFARGDATATSPVEIILFTENPERYLNSRSWIKPFGFVTGSLPESHGAVRALRVFFENGTEVLFGFAQESWASVEPVNQCAYDVVLEGATVLFDPKAYLEKLLKRVDLRTRT